MLRRLLILIPAVALALVIAGCGAQFRYEREELANPSPWPVPRGTVEATGAYPGGTFAGHLDVLWEKRDPGKPSGPLTLQHGFLVYPSVKRRFRFRDSETGDYIGKIKSRAPSQTGLTGRDSIGCFAVQPPRNQLTCMDLLHGDHLWQTPVKDASGGSIIVENRLLIGAAGRLTAYNLSDGEIAWTFEVEDRFTAPPSYGRGTVFQPGESGTLYALESDSGQERFRVELDGPSVAAAAVGDLVYAADMRGHVFGLDPADGRVVWKTDVGGPVWTAPAVADGRVFVGHSGGEVVALDAVDGHVLWRFETIEVVRASVTVVGSYVIAGTLGGNLYSLNAADGTVVDRRELKGGIAEAPVTDGARVYVATEDGYIICFGERNEQAQQVHQ